MPSDCLYGSPFKVLELYTLISIASVKLRSEIKQVLKKKLFLKILFEIYYLSKTIRHTTLFLNYLTTNKIKQIEYVFQRIFKKYVHLNKFNILRGVDYLDYLNTVLNSN